MPDPRISLWTAAWKEAVEKHIDTPDWRRSMQYIGFNDVEKDCLKDLLYVLIRLPEDSPGDIKLLIEAWQQGELPVVRSLYGQLPKTRLQKLEALARGEVKTISFVPPPVTDEADDFDVSDRPTPIYELADGMGAAMDSPRVSGSDAPSERKPLPTIPAPPDPELLRQSLPSTHDDEDGFPAEEVPTAKREIPCRTSSGLQHLYLPRDIPAVAPFVSSDDPELEIEFDLASPIFDEEDDGSS